MNYFKMFKDAGIIDNEIHSISIEDFDTDKNCQKSIDALYRLIEQMDTDNDVKIDLLGFIMDVKDIYKEVGVNLGCFFIRRYFNNEFRLNFCDTVKLETKKISKLNVNIDILFNRVGEILLNPDNEKLFSGLQLKIYGLKRDLILEAGVPEEAINFVHNSAELNELIYFLIKTGFICGFLLYLVFNTLHMQLSVEVMN